MRLMTGFGSGQQQEEEFSSYELPLSTWKEDGLSQHQGATEGMDLQVRLTAGYRVIMLTQTFT